MQYVVVWYFWQFFPNFSRTERARAKYVTGLSEKPLRVFLRLFCVGFAKYVSWGWWQLLKMRTDLGGRYYLVGNAPPHLTYMIIVTKLFRSSQLRCFMKKSVLRIFAKFTGKHLYQSLFFNKVADLRPKACNFIKKETLVPVLSCEFYEISKNTFFT